MLKHIFKPIVSTAIGVAAYSALGLLFYLELGDSLFLTAGAVISAMFLAAHVFVLGKSQKTTKNQHLAVLLAELAAMLLMLVFHALTIKRSDFFLLFLSLASLPPFYNFCGYARFTRVDENISLPEYALGVLLVPFAAFLVYNHYQGSNYKTVYLILAVGAYYFVIFSLVKMAALAFKKKSSAGGFAPTPRIHRLVTVFLMLVMPLTGLLLNQYGYSYVSMYAEQTGYTYSSHANEGFFGDFSHPIFYVLTIINAALLLIPPEKYQKLKLPMFFARAVGFSFISYMLVVFLPVLPVGVLMLFFIVGVYAFVPLAAFWWQGKMMLAEYRGLLASYKKAAAAVFLLGFLTLPTVLAFSFARDKANFELALAYASGSNVGETDAVDIPALERSLEARYASSYRTRLYGSTVRAYYSYNNIPIISGAYNMYMYGGEDLTWECLDTLGALFFNGGYYGSYDETDLSGLDYYTEGNAPVEIANITHDTRYDESIGAYRTWVNLSLENRGDDKNEYTANFHLPDGVYVSDYYLNVNGEIKMGMLTDRRAALTVYRRIVQRALDPGVLHYIEDGLLELRVFPFDPYQRRETGFELIHKNGFLLEIDGRRADISAGERVSETRLPGAVLLSADEIAQLPPLERKPVYHFVLDCSEDSDVEYLSRLIREYCRQEGIEDAFMYLTSYRVEKRRLYGFDKKEIRREGGFNLSLAVRDVIRSTGGGSVPVIIYATQKEDDTLFRPEGLGSYASPELPFYYRLNAEWNSPDDYGYMPYGEPYLTEYSMATNRGLGYADGLIIEKTVSYEGRTVIDDGEDKLVILDPSTFHIEEWENQYLEALALDARNRFNARNSIKNPVNYIVRSFRARVLTPSTAFIVVETEEQEQALLKLQEEILKSREDGEAYGLDEPLFLVLAALAAVCWVCYVRRAGAVS